MSADLHTKRRRASEEGGAEARPPAKRINYDAASAVSDQLQLRESRRAEIRSIYTNYGAILQGSGNEAVAFQGLLDCAQGSLAARRLAARLVPRLLVRFPAHTGAAAKLLMQLHTAPESPGDSQPCGCTLPGEQKLVEDTRKDALRGLGNVLEVAVRDAGRHVPVVLEVVQFLLRLLFNLSTCLEGSAAAPGAGARSGQAGCPAGSSAAPVVHVNGTTVGPGHGSNSDLNLAEDGQVAGQEAYDDLSVIQHLLLHAFGLFPRVVLMCCLQPHRGPTKQRDTAASTASLLLLEEILLPHDALAAQQGGSTDAVHAYAAAGSRGAHQHAASGEGESVRARRHVAAAASGDARSADAAVGSDAAAGHGAGAGAGPGGSSAPVGSGGRSVAAKVLGALPETQAWLRQAVLAVIKDNHGGASLVELRPFLDQLLQLCPASAASQAAAAYVKRQQAAPLLPDGRVVTKVEPGGGMVLPSPQPASTRSADSSRGVPMDIDQPSQSTRGQLKVEPDSQHLLQGSSHAASGHHPPPTLQIPQHPHLGQPTPPPPPPLPAAASLDPAAVASAALLQLRGGSVCRAEPCLFVTGLLPGLPEASLVTELSRCGAVESVHGLSGTVKDENSPVVVVFVTLRDAAMCYEAIANTCAFGGTRPLVVEFCSALPPDSPAARRRAAAAAAGGSVAAAANSSQFVWVSAAAGGLPPVPPVTPEAVLAVLQDGGLQNPQQILRVAGGSPGLLLHMASPSICPQTVACLQARYPHASVAQLPPPPAFGFPGPQAGMASAAGTPLPAGTPSGAAAAAATGGAFSPMAGAGQAFPPDMPPGCRTLWVGQLHDSVRDEELLAVCRKHGETVGFRFLRSSHCAFVDFQTPAGALAALRAINGMRLGPQSIRVEWKTDPHAARAMAASRGSGRPATPTTSVTSPTAGMAAAQGQGLPPPPPLSAGQPHHGPGTVMTPGGASGPAVAAHGLTRHGSTHKEGLSLPPPPLQASGGSAPAGSSTPHGAPPAAQSHALAPASSAPAQQRKDGPSAVMFKDGRPPLLLPPMPMSMQHGNSLPPPPPPHPMVSPMGGPGGGQMPLVHGHSHAHPHQITPGPGQGLHASASMPQMTGGDWGTPQGHPGMGLPPKYSLQGAESGPGPGQLPPLPSEPPPPPPPGSTPSGSLVGANALSGHMDAQQPAQSAVPTWQGQLAKSGAHMCALVCREGGAPPGSLQGAREPAGWPATLDVRMRVDLSYVVQTMYNNTPMHARALRRLVPAGGPDDRSKLSEFILYLAEKNRAGVIKLEQGSGLPPRTLYLLPPSDATCAALGVSWAPQREPLLLALVVPTSSTGGK